LFGAVFPEKSNVAIAKLGPIGRSACRVVRRRRWTLPALGAEDALATRMHRSPNRQRPTVPAKSGRLMCVP